MLDLPGVVISDGNAAASTTRFRAAPLGLEDLDENLVFAKYWNDPDPWIKVEKKRARCAEVLVAHEVPLARHEVARSLVELATLGWIDVTPDASVEDAIEEALAL